MRRASPAALAARLVEQWPDAVLVADARGRIAYVNRAFELLTGYSRREVLGKTPALLKSGAQHRAFYRRLWQRLRRGEPFRGVFVNRRKNGELFHEEEIIRPLRGPGGRVAWFASAGRDVSATMREHRRLRHAATHDPLTRLPNRRLFDDRLAQALHSAARRKERFAVAIVDVDNFKAVNTQHGHLAGDAVLRAAAQRTSRSLRAVDTVARFGGDELALIVAPPLNRQALATVLDKVRRRNARPIRYRGKSITVSVSVGGAIFPTHGRRAAGLLRRADKAMYEAKKAGGDTWRMDR